MPCASVLLCRLSIQYLHFCLGHPCIESATTLSDIESTVLVEDQPLLPTGGIALAVVITLVAIAALPLCMVSVVLLARRFRRLGK